MAQRSKTKKTPGLAPEQRAELIGRIREFDRRFDYDDFKEKEPRAVKHARATLDRWEERQRRLTGNAKERHDDAVRTARQAVLFGAPGNALAAVELLEWKKSR